MVLVSAKAITAPCHLKVVWGLVFPFPSLPHRAPQHPTTSSSRITPPFAFQIQPECLTLELIRRSTAFYTENEMIIKIQSLLPPSAATTPGLDPSPWPVSLKAIITNQDLKGRSILSLLYPCPGAITASEVSVCSRISCGPSPGLS